MWRLGYSGAAEYADKCGDCQELVSRNWCQTPINRSDTLSEALLTRLRENTNACTVIGNDRFKEQIATMLGRAVPTGKRDRPKKLA